jgi:signal transduction histidine kinase
VEVVVDVQAGLDLPTDVERLVFRTAQEAIRNVGAHAAAEHVTIDVAQTNGTVTLRVADDGRGVDADELARRRLEGHMGLAMLQDLAETAGGRLQVTSPPGGGTIVELEVAVP